MPIAQSKLTAQGQISVPAEIRRRLGVGPGAMLEWSERGGDIVVSRAATATLADMHKTLFPNGAPKPKSLKGLKDGVARAIRARHARD